MTAQLDIDEQAVQWVCQGAQMKLTTAEAREVVRRLDGKVDATEIARRLHTSRSNVEQIRCRIGIAKPRSASPDSPVMPITPPRHVPCPTLVHPRGALVTLKSLIKSVLAEHPYAGPEELAMYVASATPAADIRTYYNHLLIGACRAVVNKERSGIKPPPKPSAIPRPKPTPSPKLNERRSWWGRDAPQRDARRRRHP
jgi:hypothetical protein